MRKQIQVKFWPSSFCQIFQDHGAHDIGPVQATDTKILDVETP